MKGGRDDLAGLLARYVPHVRIRMRYLSAPDGRQDALLCPNVNGGFTIVVDPRPSPRDPTGISSATLEPSFVRWRIAHELGHVFFYDDSRPARRWTTWSPTEEEWADSFARHLLDPEGAHRVP